MNKMIKPDEDASKFVMCEACGERHSIQEYDGEMQCFDCIREAFEYEEGQLFDRGMLHNK